MDDESTIIRRIAASWPANVEDPQRQRVFRQLLQEVEEGLRRYPMSSQLHCMRGDLIQLQPEDAALELNEALYSYQEAARIAPENARAHESIGYFFDAILGDPVQAEPHFRRALELENRVDSVYGLARVLSQCGKKQQAMDLLTNFSGQDPEGKLQDLLHEIEAGFWDC